MATKFSISAVISMVDRMSGPARRLGRTINSSVVRPAAKATTQISALAGRLTKLGVATGALAGAAGVAALTKTVTSYADAADRMAKSSRQVNLSVEALSELSYAADISGVSFDDLLASLRPFTKQLGEAKVKQGALYTLLKKQSPELLKQLNAAGSAEEAFSIMAGSIAALEDPSKRSLLMMTAFGRSGSKLATLFADGAEGVNKLRAAARAKGFVLSEEEAVRAEEFNDRLNDAKRSVTTLGWAIGRELVPEITPLVTEFTGWVQANRGLVGVKVREWVTAVGDALRGVDWPGVGTAIKDIGTAAKDLAEKLGGLEGITKIAAATFAVSLLSGVGKATIAVITFGISLATTVAPAIIAATTALVGLATRGLAAVLVGTLNLIPNLAIGLVGGLKAAMFAARALWLTLLANPFVAIAAIATAVVLALVTDWSKVGLFFRELWAGIKLMASDLWGWIKDTARSSVQPLIDAWDAAWAYIEPIIDGIKQAIDVTMSGLRAIGVIDAAPTLSLAGAPSANSLAGFARFSGADEATQAALRSIGSKSQVDVNVHLGGAPPGTRVDAPRTKGDPVGGAVSVKSDLGRRTLGSGGPL